MNDNYPLPLRMRKLKLDRRGYPIPFTVWYDDAGVPQFTVNDEVKRQYVIAEDRCPICGGKLNRIRWFVGGPASAFDERGAYIDPPMHDECAHYALNVCPYLAAPRYGKRIDALKAELSGTHPGMIFTDNSMIDFRPQIFIAVAALRTLKFGGAEFGDHRRHVKYVAPSRPYRRVEQWQQGELISVGALPTPPEGWRAWAEAQAAAKRAGGAPTGQETASHP